MKPISHLRDNSGDKFDRFDFDIIINEKVLENKFFELWLLIYYRFEVTVEMETRILLTS